MRAHWSRRKRQTHVPVSGLAQVATCERKVYLEAKHGERRSEENRRAAERGKAIHKMAEREPLRSGGGSETRCFIATVVYGADAAETEALRAWRDRSLMPSPVGRALVALYYRVSPAVAAMLARSALASKVTKAVLDRIVRRVT